MCTWTARLGLFLFTRVHRDGGDSRFDEVKTKPGMFLAYWAIQGRVALTPGVGTFHVLSLFTFSHLFTLLCIQSTS